MLLLLTACAQDPCLGLDMNQDGVCDNLAADWSQDAWVEPGTDRANIYALSPEDLETARWAGLEHVMVWPVSVSSLRMPYRPLVELLDNPDNATIQGLTRQVAGFGTMDELYEQLGLPPIPEDGVPLPNGLQPGDPMGAAVVDTELGEALVFSCAACHATELFGQTVVGIGNKTARPNAFFTLASEVLPTVPADVFQDLSGATDDEVQLYQEMVTAIGSVGTKDPVVLGLDTSLAQVHLSLQKRGQDPYASFDTSAQYNPRDSILDELIADSKPTPWWTLRYKTTWLADGSIVQGNPILTNFLWNELGRGTDLERLETWLVDNERVVDELTVAVFATPSPRWEDWFGADSIDLEQAKTGQALFEQHCSACHGSYEKGWDLDSSGTPAEQIQTTGLLYHGATPRFDVGTDPGRAQGMTALEDLNDLAISQAMETIVQGGEGYVPPPLDGIWARYPYLHNNAAPTLCALLSPVEQRPSFFVQGPAQDPETDFDADCVGYPTGDAIPEHWLEVEDAGFDVSQAGLSNQGHTSMLYGPDGELVFTDEDRLALIEFLKTL